MEYKNQHYVPQFYLRAFSFTGKEIALFNLKQRKLVHATGIASQCSENYFYGDDDEPEKALSLLVEAPASKVLSGIIRNEEVPKNNSEEYATMLGFVLFQDSRTLYASKAGAELMKKFIEPNVKRMMLQSGDFTEDEIKEIEVKAKRPANRLISIAAEMFPVILDLKIKLLVNKTSQEFITSDHPVVRINQFLFGDLEMGVTGWAVKGLQVFTPVSPKHTIMLYDEKIYKVGSRSSDIVFVTKESDLEALNDLQLLNAHENVYFRDVKQGLRVLKQFESCCTQRRKEKAETRFIETTDDMGIPCLAQHVYAPNLAFQRDLSFCKLQKSKKRQGREYGLRQPDLVAAHRKFLECVDEGKYQHEEWAKFMDDFSQGRIE